MVFIGYDEAVMKYSCRVQILMMILAASSCSQAHTQAGDQGFAQLFHAGESAMASGRYEEAISDFQRLEKMNSGVAEVHATLGVLYYKQSDFERALAELRQAHKLKPGLAGIGALTALSLAELGRGKEALPELERTFHAQADPEIKRLTGLQLMRVYSELAMDDRAVQTALELRDLYKDDPEVLYNVGKTLGNSAYLTMQTLFHSSGTSVWAKLAEAEAQESQGLTVDAIKSYQGVLAIDPHRANIHYRMGRTYLAQWGSTHSKEDLTEAATEFAKEIALNPSNANAAYELA